MKRIIVLFLSILFVSCSSLQMKKDENKEEIIYKTLYQNWQLDQLRTKIDLDSAKYGKNPTIIYYEKALLERLNDKKELFNLLNKIKTEFKSNEIITLDKALDMPLKGRFIKEELKNIDLSKLTINYTKPQFQGDKASNIIAFRYAEEIMYFQVQYKLINNSWKIINFQERR